MPEINELLSNLGISVPAAGSQKVANTRASQVIAQGKRNTALTAARKPKVSPQTTTGSKRTTAPKTKQVVYDTPLAFGSYKAAHADEDDGAWGIIGDIGAGALELIDTPRAYAVSAFKEITDFATTNDGILGALVGNGLGWSTGQRQIMATGGDHDDASWSDFTRQGSEHMGFGDVIEAEAGAAPHWAKVTAGIAGDVLLDPLTYTGAGVGGLTREGAQASRGLKVALEAGGRNTIAKETTKAVEYAIKEGLEHSPALDKLIANAAQKGRGAFTRRALEKIGLSEAERAYLAIPELTRTFAGAAIPGTRILSDITEGTKGAFKAWTGATKAGKAFRAWRGSDSWGLKTFTNILRDSTSDVEKKVVAAKALTTINDARMQAEHWVSGKVREISSTDFGKGLRKLDDKAGAELVHGVEAGVRNELTDEFTSIFTKMHAELKELGVDVPFRENYVPHFTTREAARLANTSPKARKFIESITTKEGFQEARLTDESISVLNAKFAAETGSNIKLLETDPEIILQRYMLEATDAIGRSTQSRLLKEIGVIEPQALVRDLDAPVTRKLGKGVHGPRIKDVERQADRELKKIYKNAEKVSEETLDRNAEAAEYAATKLKEQKGNIGKQLADIDREVKLLQRTRVAADQAVDDLTAQLDTLQAQLDANIKILKDGRPAARRQARAAIARIEKEIPVKEAALKDARAKVVHIMENYQAPLGKRVEASRGFASEAKRLGAERAELLDAQGRLSVELESLKLKNAAPGEGPTLSDQVVRESQDEVAKITAKRLGAINDADIAMKAYDFAVAGAEATKPLLDASVQDIDKALDVARKIKNPSQGAKKIEQLAEARERLVLLQGAIGKFDGEAADILAQVEVVGAMADARLAVLSREGKYIEQYVHNLNSREFQQYMKRELKEGFRKINDAYQIPDWVDEALKVERMISDPKYFVNLGKFYDQAQNLWKGYAVMRPGFVTRNVMSSVFNVYLEAGAEALPSLKKFRDFYKVFTKHPDNYLEVAATELKFTARELENMDSALKIIHASGSGQGAEEVGVSVFGGMSPNPLSADFAPVRAVRKSNEVVENWIRGGHAYDVLQRGGSTDLALDTIEKWHFNYRDISEFDRAAKRVMPFWMFFSRNMSLQAQTWPQTLKKLNRTYFNVARNLSVGEDPDVDTPIYFDRASPIRLPGGSGADDSDVNYLFPDLPAVQFQNDLDQVLGFAKGAVPGQDMDLRLLGNMAPLPKAVLELGTGTQFYSGQEFKGWNSPRVAEGYEASGPVQAVLGAFGGGGTNASGDPLITDYARYGLQSVLPPLGQARNLGGEDAGAQDWLSWLGVSTRTNNSNTRKSERYRREQAMAEEIARVNALRG